MSKYIYYCHPAYRNYLNSLKAFLTSAGKLSNSTILLGDAEASQLSRNQRKVFRENYGGSIQVLTESVNRQRENVDECWARMFKAAQAARLDDNRCSWQEIVNRANKTPRPNLEIMGASWEDCLMVYGKILAPKTPENDLRGKVHEWVNSQRKLLASGEVIITTNPEAAASTVKDGRVLALSIGEILDRYKDLLEKRQEKRKG